MARKKAVTWNGVEYPTLADAARENYISKGGLQHRLRMGYRCDGDVPPPGKARPVRWNGVEYPTLTDAARALGLNVTTLYNRLRKGYASDNDLQRR